MATWNIDLPAEKTLGDDTHVADHNTIVEAIAEAREVLDAIETAVGAKADGDHKHAAADVTSGTLDAARVPALAISKISGLQAAIDGKASAADLTSLASRVEALEAATPEAT